MKIKVIGKRQGTSKKSGKPYLRVAYLTYMNGGEGETGESLFLDPTEYEYKAIKVGDTYDAEFTPKGYLVSFNLAK